MGIKLGGVASLRDPSKRLSRIVSWLHGLRRKDKILAPRDAGQEGDAPSGREVFTIVASQCRRRFAGSLP